MSFLEFVLTGLNISYSLCFPLLVYGFGAVVNKKTLL